MDRIEVNEPTPLKGEIAKLLEEDAKEVFTGDILKDDKTVASPDDFQSSQQGVLYVNPKTGKSENISIAEAKERAQNFEELSFAEKKRIISRVMTRGLSVQRGAIDLPDDLYGEWVAKHPSSIARAQMMGFKIDTKFAEQNATHSDGSSCAMMGDAIFMTCSKKTHLIHEEVKKEMYRGINPLDRGTQGEEAGFVEQMRKTDLSVVQDSSMDKVSGDQISSALTSKE